MDGDGYFLFHNACYIQVVLDLEFYYLQCRYNMKDDLRLNKSLYIIYETKINLLSLYIIYKNTINLF